jgi:predicted ATPase/DNA-binding winged helix-turn-helix (wHTH) protein
MTTAADGSSFGPFRLVASERLLTRDGVAVELRSRALDILIALISKPNELVSKKELMSRVWPGLIVEDGSLRFHMAGLRKALGDGKGGARYIATLPGRGYCFVAPVSRPINPGDDVSVVSAVFPYANLPSRLCRMVGRDDDVLKLSVQLSASRFVTIAGAGGIGKTTVAIAVGHHLTEAFAGAVLFVDLGMLSDPDLVTTAVASMLGLSVQSNDATPNLVAYLRDKRILLILDTCEHLVEAVAAMAASITDAASQVHILATSREPLRVESEHIYRLDPLACPPDDAGLTAAVVRTFPATQLFVERAAASGARLEICDAEAPIVASICRKLGGVALAIELAARRVESYGLQQTAALLDQSLTLLWPGSRTAPPRQRTLHATLDWSFGLLSEVDRVVLRRLAVFVGHFTLDAVLEVVTSATLDRSTAIALFWAITVFLWTGESQSAQAYIDRLISLAESRSLAPYLLVARGFQAEVAIRHGDARGGVESLRRTLQKLHAAPYEMVTAELNLSLVGGLSAIGQFDEAISLIDESLAQVERNGNLLYVPELLRVKGTLLLLLPDHNRNNAEACFLQALELSRHQGARAWELRAAIDLAKLLANRGEADAAHDLLRPIFGHFVEGRGTPDLKAAERLLATLRD